MIYKIRDSKKKYMLEAYDKDNNLVGEAVISPFMDSDLSEKSRLNIYIDITVTDVANKIELKDQMFAEIMKRARAIKEENKDIDVIRSTIVVFRITRRILHIILLKKVSSMMRVCT